MALCCFAFFSLGFIRRGAESEEIVCLFVCLFVSKNFRTGLWFRVYPATLTRAVDFLLLASPAGGVAGGCNNQTEGGWCVAAHGSRSRLFSPRFSGLNPEQRTRQKQDIG
jgi:hypothetical protein